MDFFIENGLILADAFSEAGEFQVVFDEEKGLYLIDVVIEYGPDDSCIVSKEYSSDPFDSIKTRSSSGSKTTSRTKEYIQGGTLIITYWVSGTFTWDGETCTVSGASKGYTNSTAPSVTSSELSSASDQGSNFGLGNKYAYAQHDISIKNYLGTTINLSAYVEVNRNGTERRA